MTARKAMAKAGGAEASSTQVLYGPAEAVPMREMNGETWLEWRTKKLGLRR
jgi:hypothetical protein